MDSDSILGGDMRWRTETASQGTPPQSGRRRSKKAVVRKVTQESRARKVRKAGRKVARKVRKAGRKVARKVRKAGRKVARKNAKPGARKPHAKSREGRGRKKAGRKVAQRPRRKGRAQEAQGRPQKESLSSASR